MTLNNGKNNINYNDFPTPDIGQVRRLKSKLRVVWNVHITK